MTGLPVWRGSIALTLKMTLWVLPDTKMRKLGPFSVAILMFFGVGCVATVPQTAQVENAELPDYKVGSHRVEEAIDLYIEPRIRALRRNVTPRSENEEFNAIPVVVGPSLELALLGLTRQHFTHVTPVAAPAGRPTLSYRLLTYKPVVAVVPGIFTTRLNVSARLALQVSIHSSAGEELFTATAIGTSHVSDTEISAGDGLKDGPRLLAVATRDAIIDAMYNISSVFGNSSGTIHDEVLRSETNPGIAIETMDDVVMYLQTWQDQ
jgi:hypothetical protein